MALVTDAMFTKSQNPKSASGSVQYDQLNSYYAIIFLHEAKFQVFVPAVLTHGQIIK